MVGKFVKNKNKNKIRDEILTKKEKRKLRNNIKHILDTVP